MKHSCTSWIFLLIYWLTLVVKGSSQACGSSNSSQIAPLASANAEPSIWKCQLILQATRMAKVGNLERQTQILICIYRFWFASLSSHVHFILVSHTSCLSFLPSNGLIPHTLLISLFPQVPNLGVAYLAHGLSPGFDQVLAKVIFSSGGSTKGGSTCSCWQDSVHLWLWDWGPHFLIGCGPVFP